MSFIRDEDSPQTVLGVLLALAALCLILLASKVFGWRITLDG